VTTQQRHDWLIRAGWIALLACAAGLRLLNLPAKPFWLDEAWSHWFSGQAWTDLIGGVIRYDTHPPFYYGILKLWRALAGDGELALRSLSVIASIATIVLVPYLARRCVESEPAKAAGFVAVALLAVSPPLVEAARQARPYALLVLAFAAAMMFALQIMKHWQGEQNTAVGRKIWAGYIIALTAVLWLHTLGALHAFAISCGLALALFNCGLTRQRILDFLIAHAFCFVFWLPSLAILQEQQKNWTKATWLVFRPETAGMDYVQAVAAPGVVGLGLILLAGCGLVFGLRQRTTRNATLFLLICAAIPALLELLLSLTVSPVFLGRTLVPGAVAIALLASLPAAIAPRPLVPHAVTAIVSLGMIAACWQMVSRAPEERWRDVGRAIAEKLAPGDEVWLLPNELVLPFQLANPELASRTEVRPLPHGFPARPGDGPHPSGTAAVVAMTEDTAQRLVADARQRGVHRVWVVSRFAWLFDPHSTLDSALGAQARIERSERFAPLVIQAYQINGPGDQAAEASGR